MIETHKERLAKVEGLIQNGDKGQAYVLLLELYREEPRDKDILMGLVQASPNPVSAFWYWHQLRQADPNDPRLAKLFRQVIKELYTWLRTTGKSLVTEPGYDEAAQLLREMLDTTSLEADEKEVLEWVIVKAGLGAALGLGGGGIASTAQKAGILLGLTILFCVLFPTQLALILGIAGILFILLGIWFIFEQVLFAIDAGRIAIKASKILMRHAKKQNLFGLAKDS